MFCKSFPQLLTALGAGMKNIFVRINSDFVYEVEVLRYIPGLEDGFAELDGRLCPFVITPFGNKIPDDTSFITIDEVGNKDVYTIQELKLNFRPRKMDE